MTFREIQPEEIDFLSDMLYEAIFVEEGQAQPPRSIILEDHLARYIQHFGKNELDICLVAIENRQLIGACWGRLFPEENKGYGFVDPSTPELSIAIKSGFRNRGIGSILIEELVQKYRGLQVKSISLSVDKKNKAFQLYQKVGFETVVETEKSTTMLLKL